MNKVSLIIPVCNAGPWFDEMLDSVIAQTWQNIQLIVVNDGSTDDSEEVFRSHETGLKGKFGEVIYCSHGKNLGASAAVNTALPFCDGEYLCQVDADDILMPDSIRKKAEYLDQFPELAMVRTNGVQYDQESGMCTEVAGPGDKRVRSIFEDLLFYGTYCLNGCYMMRSEVFFSCYPDRRIPVSEQGQNMQLLLPPASCSDCGYIDDILFRYRIRPQGHHMHFTKFPEMLERKKEFMRLQLVVLPHCRCDQALWEDRIRRYWEHEIENLKQSYLDVIRRHHGGQE